MIRLYFPWNNLGCFGLKIGNWFYGDIYFSPYFGAYWRIKNIRRRCRFLRFWKVFRERNI